jgi:hypothetical protein
VSDARQGVDQTDGEAPDNERPAQVRTARVVTPGGDPVFGVLRPRSRRHGPQCVTATDPNRAKAQVSGLKTGRGRIARSGTRI